MTPFTGKAQARQIHQTDGGLVGAGAGQGSEESPLWGDERGPNPWVRGHLGLHDKPPSHTLETGALEGART